MLFKSQSHVSRISNSVKATIHEEMSNIHQREGLKGKLGIKLFRKARMFAGNVKGAKCSIN